MREKTQKYLIRGPIALVLVGILMILTASALLYFYHYIMPSHDKDQVFTLFKIGFYFTLVPLILFQFLYPSNILAKVGIKAKFSFLIIAFLYLIFFPVVDYLFIIVLNSDLLFIPLYGAGDSVYYGTAKYYEVVSNLIALTFVFYLATLFLSLVIKIFVKKKDKKKRERERYHYYSLLDEDDD